ncbi:MAG TPA: hypothetical protein VKP13_17960 [Nitrospira sp.]|nr:hypothetical protein [Nitrospira sp.]
MKRSKFPEEPIVYALRQAEGSTPSVTCAGSSGLPSRRSMPGRNSMSTSV